MQLCLRGSYLSDLQNGLGAFILQCKRLDFHYCDWAGSSRGMKYASFLPQSNSLSLGAVLTNNFPSKCFPQIKPSSLFFKSSSSDRDPNIASSTQTSCRERPLYQWPRESHLRAEFGKGASSAESRAINASQWGEEQKDQREECYIRE